MHTIAMHPIRITIRITYRRRRRGVPCIGLVRVGIRFGFCSFILLAPKIREIKVILIITAGGFILGYNRYVGRQVLVAAYSAVTRQVKVRVLRLPQEVI